jgi:hypothetical protein
MDEVVEDDQVIPQVTADVTSPTKPVAGEKEEEATAISKDTDTEMQVDGDVETQQQQPKTPDENQDPNSSATKASSSTAALVAAKSVAIPTIDLVPPTYRKAHKSVIIGNPKLSEFRKILQDRGFKTRFAAGKLLVNGKVVVRKDTKSTSATTGGGGGHGSLIIEGVLGSVYYDVRRLLYSQLTVL